MNATIRRDLLAAFRTRLVRDTTLLLVGYGIVISASFWVLVDDEPTGKLLWCIGVLLLTTVTRALWQSSVARRDLSDAGLLRELRSLAVLQGSAWGVGVALFAPLVPADDLTVVLVCLGGFIASAAKMLDADKVSMRIYVVALLGPVVGGQLLGSTENGVLLAVVIALFGFVTLLLHSRAYGLLEESVRGRILLEASHQEIAHEKAYLEGLLRSAPLAVAVLDDGKHVRFVNDRFQQLFGYTAEELRGKDLSTLLVPTEQAEEHERLNRTTLQGAVMNADVVRLAKGGRRITVRVSAAAVEDTISGGMVVMYEDITEERATQARLEERERRLSSLVDSNIVGIAFWEIDGPVTEANDEYLRITGYDRADLEAGRVNFRTMITPEQAELTLETTVQLLQGIPVAPWELDVTRKDGTLTPALLAIASLGDTREKGVCFVVDIAARREAELQLTRKTALLEAQVSSTLDGILVVDANGRTVLTNPQMGEMWQLPPALAAELNDRERLDFVARRTKDPGAFLGKVEHLYAHPDETSRDEVALADGTTFDRYSAPVIGAGGEHYGRIWTFRDITSSKDAERKLQEARALAEQTAENRAMFLANMSHEIRTPMNAVLGMLELVLDTELTAEQRRYLLLASTSAEGLLGILNDVLDYSKIGAGRIDLETIAFDFPRVIQSTAELLAGRAVARGIELVVDIAPDLPTMVQGDPTRLRQVLTNLLGNAIKFTERGEVVVVARPVPMEDGRPWISLAIRDTGIGMTPDQLGHLFEAFTQGDGSTNRRFGGTGLGLAISERLVGLMGGRITVTSEPGRGSEFTIVLPFVAAPAAAAVVPFASDMLAGQVILVVDDNAINRHLLDRMLTAAGARVLEADGAASALAQLRSARAAGADRALAILDGRMPETDGFELARQIRADPLLADTPLLMLTSSGQRGDAARCRDLGIPGYLTKPVSQADLLEAVAAIVHGAGAAEAQGGVITRHTLAEARQPLRILLAEDNPVNQVVAATMLRKRGHWVEVVADGREAIAAVRQGRFDVILMDIQMPEVDGYAATARIRELPGGRTLPIIALTAHAYGEERERCLAAGMNGFVTKPCKAVELFAAVEGTSAGIPLRPVPATVAGPVPFQGPVVDIEGFRTQLRRSGIESELDGILDTFLESTPSRRDELCDALVSGSPAQVATAAHALRSSAGAIWAYPLAGLLTEIETAGNSDSLVERGKLATEVDDGFAAVMGEVREYRGVAS